MILPRFAWRGIGVVLLADAVLLLATVNHYGYHRDELYFRVLAGHPAWGYVDQPPGTPLLAKAGIAIFGDNLYALRVPAMLCALTAVALTALLARDLGGGPAAQVLAAAGTSSAFVLTIGHALSTASLDLVIWLLVILFAQRALRRGEPRWWLAAGLTVGVGLYNKQLVVLLLLGLAAGLLIAGPRHELRSPWLWAGAAVALLVGLPNLIYQATHHWPELSMAQAISAGDGDTNRALLLPYQLVMLGLSVVPIWVAGYVALWRRVEYRVVRALAWAYPVVLVIVLATGGQIYYPVGLLIFGYAAGCVVTARWAAGHRNRWAWTGSALAITIAISVPIALPVFPLASLPPAIAAINPVTPDSIGWPTYVRQVAAVYQSLPPKERAHTVLLAENYGEYGALDRFGPTYGLPAVFSGHNELWRFGPPPDWASTVIVVGDPPIRGFFRGCERVGVLDDHSDIDNEEQGNAITVCRGPQKPWNRLWPASRHLG